MEKESEWKKKVNRKNERKKSQEKKKNKIHAQNQADSVASFSPIRQ